MEWKSLHVECASLTALGLNDSAIALSSLFLDKLPSISADHAPSTCEAITIIAEALFAKKEFRRAASMYHLARQHCIRNNIENIADATNSNFNNNIASASETESSLNNKSNKESRKFEAATLLYRECLCLVELREEATALHALEKLPVQYRDVKINLLLGKLYKDAKLRRHAIGVLKDAFSQAPMAIEIAEELVLLGVQTDEIIDIVNKRKDSSTAAAGTTAKAERKAEASFPTNSPSTNNHTNSNNNITNKNFAKFDFMQRLITAMAHRRDYQHKKSISLLRSLLLEHPNNEYLLTQLALTAAEADAADVQQLEFALSTFAQLHRGLQSKNTAVAGTITGAISFHGMDIYGKLLLLRVNERELNRLANDLLAANPRRAVSWTVAAMYCALKSDLERANAFIEKAIELEPGYVGSYQLKGYLNFQEGNLDHALSAYKIANSIRQDLTTFTGIVQTYVAVGNLKDGVSAAREAITLFPRCPTTYVLMGDVLSKAKSPQGVTESQRAYRKALKLDPYNKTAVSRLADALFAQKQHEEAVECLRAVLNQSNSHKLRLQLAQNLASLRKYREAIENLHISIGLCPKENPDAHQELERIENLLRTETAARQTQSETTNIEEEEEEEAQNRSKVSEHIDYYTRNSASKDDHRGYSYEREDGESGEREEEEDSELQELHPAATSGRGAATELLSSFPRGSASRGTDRFHRSERGTAAATEEMEGGDDEEDCDDDEEEKEVDEVVEDSEGEEEEEEELGGGDISGELLSAGGFDVSGRYSYGSVDSNYLGSASAAAGGAFRGAAQAGERESSVRGGVRGGGGGLFGRSGSFTSTQSQQSRSRMDRFLGAAQRRVSRGSELSSSSNSNSISGEGGVSHSVVDDSPSPSSPALARRRESGERQRGERGGGGERSRRTRRDTWESTESAEDPAAAAAAGAMDVSNSPPLTTTTAATAEGQGGGASVLDADYSPSSPPSIGVISGGTRSTGDISNMVEMEMDSFSRESSHIHSNNSSSRDDSGGWRDSDVSERMREQMLIHLQQRLAQDNNSNDPSASSSTSQAFARTHTLTGSEGTRGGRGSGGAGGMSVSFAMDAVGSSTTSAASASFTPPPPNSLSSSLPPPASPPVSAVRVRGVSSGYSNNRGGSGIISNNSNSSSRLPSPPPMTASARRSRSRTAAAETTTTTTTSRTTRTSAAAARTTRATGAPAVDSRVRGGVGGGAGGGGRLTGRLFDS